MVSQLPKYVVVINGVLLVACWRFEMVRISENWFRLEIRLNAFRWSTISQKQFINSSSPSICDPAGIYLLKVNNRNTRTKYKICSKLTIKITEPRQWKCRLGSYEAHPQTHFSAQTEMNQTFFIWNYNLGQNI